MKKRFFSLLLFNLSILLFFISPLSVFSQSNDYIWMEAEDGGEFNPIVVKSDPDASQQIFLASWSTDTSLDSAPSDGNIIYKFNIANEGYYRIWTRVETPDNNSNSYWIKMDSGPWTQWEDISINTNWGWDYMPSDFNLTVGEHTLTIAYREANTKIDKLVITNDYEYIPTDLGADVLRPEIPAEPYYGKSDVVEKHGQLQIINRQLCDHSGNPVQLKGVSTHGLQWFPLYKGLTIPNIIRELDIDIIRLAMYVEEYWIDDDYWYGYLGHKDEMKQKVIDFVEDAVNMGIYVVIDWHIHNDPSIFTEEAKAFFNEMSFMYKDLPNVLYEICNEPMGEYDNIDGDQYVDWSVIKAYAEEVIPVIRQNDPDNIIIVGTPNWCQQVNIAATDPLPPTYANIMYALHFYAASHKEYERGLAEEALNNIPLIVTEWGTCDYSASQLDLAEAQQWIDFLNNNKISWINWSLSNKDEAASIFVPLASLDGPWEESDFTESGKWIMEKLASEFQLGDVNHDGNIDIVDALIIAQYYTRLNPQNCDLTLADVNHDGIVNIIDSLLISQYYEGLIDSFD